MPQAAVAFSALQHLVQAQPAQSAEAQTTRARSLMNFIWIESVMLNCTDRESTPDHPARLGRHLRRSLARGYELSTTG